MASISVGQLALALQGRKFGELVAFQLKERPFADLAFKLRESKGELTWRLQDEIDELLDLSYELALDIQFWGKDCGSALKHLTGMTEDYLFERGIKVSDRDLIDIFHIVVMNFAYTGYQDPNVRPTIKASMGSTVHAAH